jgi:hypothetical protein
VNAQIESGWAASCTTEHGPKLSEASGLGRAIASDERSQFTAYFIRNDLRRAPLCASRVGAIQVAIGKRSDRTYQAPLRLVERG